ncbi:MULTISPECIES: succinylglutamate desuccinylase/aspartoacylase family protein [unclassified Duganella]|uniref:succinylglutamate desuccinylase/aspartoacylase domain-containing protein n=1 Tax=unclassified Duganella TaxID=2636909 RepID=UPI000E344737|nr:MULTISPECIES: succinylglutamate desuccinylase/aspartoacylase family protein [unclassified Duganella]RFP16317.1 succinylglutamate desuccinylase [Duganella sp. BJB475]RFP32521.1 succinylglutamate desuccinylase [Duganella sp. BJB476]
MTAIDALQFKSHQYSGQHPGTRLIVTGAVHGNETCGTKAITRVMQQLDSGALTIRKGSVTFVPVANPLAYAKGERSGERNLNRNLFPNPNPQDFEDRVANWLCPLLAQHDVLLDLHSFNAASEPFVMVGPRNNDGPLEPFKHEQQERAMARRLGVRRFVDGWLRTYGAGVQRRLRDDSQLETVLRYGMGTTEYMRSTGGYALTLECGQHADPQAPEVGYRAIVNTLAFLGLIDAPSPQPIADEAMEALSMVAVYDKQHAGDSFSRAWSSFDPVRQGELIGTRADGTPVLAEFDGRILFPDAAAGANSEWYYLTRANPGF